MYHFRLQRTDGTPADPPTYRSSTLNWRQGDQIPLTGERTLRVLGVRVAIARETRCDIPQKGSDESERVRHSLRTEAKSERRTR